MDDIPFAEKIRSLSFLSGGRTRLRVREGREHPETGGRWKATTDEGGTTHTEHAVGDRVDAVVRPSTVRAFRVRSTDG